MKWRQPQSSRWILGNYGLQYRREDVASCCTFRENSHETCSNRNKTNVGYTTVNRATGERGQLPFCFNPFSYILKKNLLCTCLHSSINSIHN